MQKEATTAEPLGAGGAAGPPLQPAYRLLSPWLLNSQHQSDKLADGVGDLDDDDGGGGSKIIMKSRSRLHFCPSRVHLPSRSIAAAATDKLVPTFYPESNAKSREPDLETGAVVDMFYT